jgi:hypothetical protein
VTYRKTAAAAADAADAAAHTASYSLHFSEKSGGIWHLTLKDSAFGSLRFQIIQEFSMI